MMAQSHLLATLLVAAVLSRFVKFTPTHWALALAFGVGIDADHLLNVPRYFLAHGVSGLDHATWMSWGAEWQGFMHAPWALLLVAPACLYWATPVPLAFWGLHMFQDFVVATRYVVWGSPMEWGIVAALAGLLVLLAWLDPGVQGSLREAVAAGRHALASQRIPVLPPEPAAPAEVVQPPRLP